MPNTLDLIVVMCGIAGIIMVVGSLLLLHRGVIQLSQKTAGSAIEAEFKNQLRLNIRNPALGLFGMGFFFFALPLYFAKHGEGEPLVIRAHITIDDSRSIAVKLQTGEFKIPVSSEGEIYTTIQPLEQLLVVADAPEYRPSTWVHPIRSDEAKNGRIEIHFPQFTRLSGTTLTAPRLDNPHRPTQ